MSVQVGSLNLDADNMRLSGKEFLINSLVIKDPVVALKNYTRLKPKDSLNIKEIAEEIQQAISWNKGKMVMKVDELRIINGTFKTDKQTDREAFTYFDGKHILFKEINATFKNASFLADTITTGMDLTAKERSGLEVKKFLADVKMTPQGMAFSNMDLQTNRSTLRNFYSMAPSGISIPCPTITWTTSAIIFIK